MVYRLLKNHTLHTSTKRETQYELQTRKDRTISTTMWYFKLRRTDNNKKYLNIYDISRDIDICVVLGLYDTRC